MRENNDKALLKRLHSRLGKRTAFEELVKTYQKPLYAHIRRIVGNHPDADDVLQNTFVKAWRFIDSFKGDSAIYTWLYRIAANEAFSHLKRDKRMEKVEYNAVYDKAEFGNNPSGDEIVRKLNLALQTLPEKQRQVFDLKYFSELKYEEIAEITGTTVGALKASYYHAVKKIEAYLSSD